MTALEDRFRLRGVVRNRDDASGLLEQGGDGAVVERGRPRLLVMLCPCGCGAEIVLNLDRRAGPAWTLYRTASGSSVYPSVWRDTGCESHFVIWNDRIFLSGRSWWSNLDAEDESALRPRVLAALSTSQGSHYADIAAALGEIPWRVLAVCRRLVVAGKANEDESGTFTAI